MDALIVEINLASCYDMIEQYCGCVLEHLSTMRKQRECPKEATEAVATLIFAAARVANLPELADLRAVFMKRYGTQLESCINKEFVEKTQKKSFSKDKKLQFMEDIAKEFSVIWSSKAFLNKISNQTAATHDQHATTEKEKHFHMKEAADITLELVTRKHEPSSKSLIQKHQLQLNECCINSHHIADGTTKDNQNKRRSNDSIPEDRPSINHEESVLSSAAEEAKDAAHANGEDRRQDKVTSGASRRTFNLHPPYLKARVNRIPSENDSVSLRGCKKSNDHPKDGSAHSPPYLKAQINRIPPENDSVSRRGCEKSNDHHKDGSTHPKLWDYDSLSAQISALRNS